MAKSKQVHIYVENGNLFMRYWWKGQSFTLRPADRPDTQENRAWCQSWATLMQEDMKRGTIDHDRYRELIAPRRRMAIIDRPRNETFLEFGEGEWYAHKRAASETKAKEYIGDMHIIVETEIIVGDKKMKFGALKLRDIKAGHIDQLTNMLKTRAGRKKSQIGGTRLTVLLHKVTRSVLDLAYERELIAKNPHGWFKSQRQEKVDVLPFSVPEMVTFLKATPTLEWRRFFVVAFGTGLGPSEQFALGWEHIDFEEKLILVRQGFVKGRLTMLKNDHRRREIDMFPHVEQALRDQWDAMKGQGRYVFPNTEGGPLHLDNLRNRVWNPTLKRTGLHPRTPYNTRHTFASQLLNRGADIAWVAKLMGHANTKMVITRYWKWIRNRSQQDGWDYMSDIGQAMKGVAGENRP